MPQNRSVENENFNQFIENKEKQIRTGCAVIKRIKRVLEETSETIIGNPQEGKEPLWAQICAHLNLELRKC